MATGNIDLNDVPFIAIFSVAAAANLGFFTLPLPVIDLNAVLFTLGNGAGKLAITFAAIASLVSLAFAFYTNRLDRSELVGVEYWIVVATVGLVLATPFQIIIDTLMMNDTAAFVGWIIQSTGILSLSYSG
jgi:hypothetical protein